MTDLGVSREVKPNNAEDTSGTPGYMAPEVICKMNHSYGVDYFALGVMAYEFMTGRVSYPPYRDLILVGIGRRSVKRYLPSKFSWMKFHLTAGVDRVLTL